MLLKMYAKLKCVFSLHIVKEAVTKADIAFTDCVKKLACKQCAKYSHI